MVCIKTFKEYCVCVCIFSYKPPDGELRWSDQVEFKWNEMKKEPTHEIYLFKTFLIFNLFIFTPFCPRHSPVLSCCHNATTSFSKCV